MTNIEINEKEETEIFGTRRPFSPHKIDPISDNEIISEDEDGEIIPANMFFPERVNILKKNEWIKFKKWGEDPCETVFAIRLCKYRVNL
jgi:hypothetical protein